VLQLALEEPLKSRWSLGFLGRVMQMSLEEFATFVVFSPHKI
jgi:hypothetical protein